MSFSRFTVIIDVERFGWLVLMHPDDRHLPLSVYSGRRRGPQPFRPRVAHQWGNSLGGDNFTLESRFAHTD
jgi:hypothetical protein